MTFKIHQVSFRPKRRNLFQNKIHGSQVKPEMTKTTEPAIPNPNQESIEIKRRG